MKTFPNSTLSGDHFSVLKLTIHIHCIEHAAGSFVISFEFEETHYFGTLCINTFLEDQLLLSVYGQLSCEELVFIHPSAPWH